MPRKKKEAGPVKLTVWAEVRGGGTREIEVPAEELEGLDDLGRERLFDSYAKAEAENMIAWGWLAGEEG